jgi:HSP90 family molecular chaperone
MPIYKGKSGVNVKRLVRNIADQYPFEAQDAALIELIANSLDAKATVIDINLNKNKGTLVVTDDGLGMDKEQFLEYHDFAASTKERGKGIGFAGQGAKLALNFCSKITTETQSTSYKGYSEWQLQGNDAPYKIHEGKTLTLNNPGSKVTLYLDDKSKTYYSKGLIEQILVEHYYPLLDEELLKVYTGRVPILIDENKD